MSHRRRRLIAVWPLFALALLTGACSSDDGGGERATDSSGVTDTTAPAADSTSGAFSYLTYNVAGLPQEVSSENPEEHIPLISPLLEPFDVVVTQEDFDWWTDDLAELDFVNYHDAPPGRHHARVRHSRAPGPRGGRYRRRRPGAPSALGGRRPRDPESLPAPR